MSRVAPTVDPGAGVGAVDPGTGAGADAGAESGSTSAPVDGRVARRDRNRAAVLDAVIDLFSEGVVDPGPEEVAQRVGLSPRSVYRYFEDRDDLTRAGIEHHLAKVSHLYAIDGVGEGPLGVRIDRFVAGRLGLYEAIAATARVARFHAATSPILHDSVEWSRRVLREQVAEQFAPELDELPARRREARLAAVDTLFELESLDHYRVHRGFTTAETAALLTDALAALLTPGPQL